jgi:hypothetical protein
MPPSEIAIHGLLERATLVPLRQPRNEEEARTLQATLLELNQAAAADAHRVINPTHLMMKGGKIVGYLSIGALPVVHCWFDTKNPQVADSLKMIEHGETVCRTQGVRDYTVACAETSPFSQHMPRLGYTKLGTTTLWRKEL